MLISGHLKIINLCSRILQYCIRLLAWSIPIILFLLTSLIGTETGMQISIKLINQLSTLHIEQHQLHGKLIGPLYANNILIKHNNKTIEIKKLMLDWSLRSLLLSRTIHIKEAKAESMTINSNQPSSQTPPHTDRSQNHYRIALPSLVIDQFKINHLSWISRNRRLNFRNVQIKAQHDDSQLLQAFARENNGTMLATLRINSADDWLTTLQANHWDLHYLYPTINSDLTVKMSLHHQPHHTVIKIHHWQGLINQHPTHAEGILDYRTKETLTGQFMMSLGDNALRIQSNKNKTATWQINASDLSQASRDLSGNITSQGQLIWRHQTWNGQLKLDARQIGWRSRTLIDQLSIAIDHQNHSNQIAGEFINGPYHIHWNTSQSGHKQHYQGILKTLTIKMGTEEWRSPQTSHWMIARDGIKISHLCLNSTKRKEQICGRVQWFLKGPIDIRLHSEHFNLSILKPWLPTGTTLNSDAQLNLIATGKNSHINNVNGQLSIDHGIWNLTDSELNHRVPIEKITAQIQQKNHRLSFSLSALIQHHSPLKIIARSNQFDWSNPKQSRLHGQISWANTPLENIPVPYVVFSQGKLDVNAKISGTLAKPVLIGNVNIAQAKAKIPSLNTTWKDIKLIIKLGRNKANGKLLALIQSHERLGHKLQGDFQIRWPHSSIIGSASIKGSHLPIVQTSEYQLWASPNITLDLKQHQAMLSGDLIIPKARISPSDFRNTERLPKDIHFANQDSSRSHFPHISARMTIKLGNDVQFKSLGIQGRLVGSMSIIKSTNKITANGQIGLNKALYNAYGQFLTINRGMLIYQNDPIGNPRLDLQAYRVVQASTNPSSNLASIATPSGQNILSAPGIPQDIIVGVKVGGTLDYPVTTLYSEPAGMSQANILSYLVLGKSIDQGGADPTALLALVGSFGNSNDGDSQLTNQLHQMSSIGSIKLVQQNYLNQDDGTISQNTAVSIGKQLSKKLSVSYSVGITDPINTFKIRYLINQRWSLQMMNNMLGSGIDFLYHF